MPVYHIYIWAYLIKVIYKSSLCLNFFHLPVLARKPNLQKFSIYSNKFFHKFHLSESSFTCPELRASGLARRLYKTLAELQVLYSWINKIISSLPSKQNHSWSHIIWKFTQFIISKLIDLKEVATTKKFYKKRSEKKTSK